MNTEQRSEVSEHHEPAPRACVRVLLAGGQRLDRLGLRALLEREPGFSVVADTPGDAAAADQVARLAPDVVVWEPPENGMAAGEAMRALAAACPNARLAALLAHPTGELVRQCLGAGVKALLGKACGASDLFDAVRAVKEGKTYLCHGAVSLLSSQIEGAAARDPASGPVLTPREREVLRLVAQGQPTKEIARTLNISVRTVDAHRRNLMTKLGRRSVAGLTQHAIRQGLVSIE